MNTYLKIDTALPSGLPYLDLNTISLPQSIVNVGNIVRGYRFTAGLDDLTGSTSSVVVGTPLKTSEGYQLGNTGYIDTGVKETGEFLWVALVRVSSGSAYTPIITNFVELAQSPTGKSLGNNLAKVTTAIKTSDANDSASAFNAANLTVGNWAILALSRRLVGTTGYSEYNYACKPAGVAIQQITSVPFTPVTNNTAQNICIGWSPKSGTLIPNATTMINLASVHSKGLDSSQLGNLVNSLVTELAQQGINL